MPVRPAPSLKQEMGIGSAQLSSGSNRKGEGEGEGDMEAWGGEDTGGDTRIGLQRAWVS